MKRTIRGNRTIFRTSQPARAKLRAAARPAVEGLESRRLFSAGQPDPTFGTGGLAVADPTLVPDGEANAVVIQADGKIVSGGRYFGQVYDDHVGTFVLVRYNADGTTDKAFGTNGVVNTPFPGSQASGINDVVLQPDGKIVAVGYARYSGNDRFAAARYLPTGQLDPTFSGDGLTTADFGAGDDGAQAVALVPGTGKIVLAGGTTNGGTGTDFAVLRLTAAGAADTSFHETGKQTIDFAGGQDGAAGVVVAADGKITVGGSTLTAAENSGDFALARLTAAGTLDPTFAGDGRQTLDFAGHYDGINDIAFGPGGTVVAAGLAVVNHEYGIGGDDYFNADAALARFTPAGAPDGSFGTGGKVTTSVVSPTDGYEQWEGLVVQNDGRLVVGGTSGDSSGHDWIAARYLPNGTIDPSFDSTGFGHVSLLSYSGESDYAHDVAVRPDGQVVLVGLRSLTYTRSLGADFGIALLAADANHDAPFARVGTLAGRLEGALGSPNAVAAQADGKVLVAGSFSSLDGQPYPEFNYYQLARFNADGTLDTSFGNKGLVYFNTTSVPDDYPPPLSDVKVLASGKILVAGTIEDNGHADLFVSRLNADGSTDATFGTNGRAVVNFGGDDGYPQLAITPAGNIFVAGSFTPAGGGNAVSGIAELSAAGKPVAAFDGDGKATLLTGIRFLAADSAGRPVVAGTDYLARLTTAGAIDQTYGVGGGRNVTPAGATINDFALAPGDRAVVTISDPNAGGFIVRRYTRDGAVDTSFGGGDGVAAYAIVNGGTTSAPAADSPPATQVAVLPDGRIVAAGLIDLGSGQPNTLGLIRLTAAGTVDTTFGPGTLPLTQYFLGVDLTDLTLDAAGRPVLAGDVAQHLDGVFTETLPFLARFQADPGPPPTAIDPRYFKLDADGTLRVTGTAAADRVQVYLSGSTLRAAVSRTTGANPGYADLPAASVTRIVVDALGGNDDVEINFNVPTPATLNGGDGDDLLVGGGGNDAMDGGAGNDKLYASPGADDLRGGTGTDTVHYGARLRNLTVSIDDNLANDGETGEGDNAHSDLEIIVGGAGNDTLRGNSAANIIYGNGGDDVLIGNDGNDTLDGGIGKDRLYGNGGNDTFNAKDGTADYLDGGTGTDKAQKDAIDGLFSIEQVI